MIRISRDNCILSYVRINKSNLPFALIHNIIFLFQYNIKIIITDLTINHLYTVIIASFLIVKDPKIYIKKSALTKIFSKKEHSQRSFQRKSTHKDFPNKNRVNIHLIYFGNIINKKLNIKSMSVSFKP